MHSPAASQPGDTDLLLSMQRLSSRVVFAQNIAKPIGRSFTVWADYTF